MTARASVIVPAHNEAGVLARSLDVLLRDADPGELDVIVVANACTDATADVARGHGVRVLETPVAGKSHALRLGDAVATTFPRLYVDADTELSTASFRELVATLDRPGVLATSPVPSFDLARARRTARRIHRVHDLLMRDRRGLAGAGVYCLNEAGHARVAPFPDVISDDGYVHRMFAPRERAVSPTASSLVRPSTTFRAALRRRVRVRQGNQQLDALGIPRAEDRLRLSALQELLRRRQITPLDAGTYLALLVADRGQVRWHALRRTEASWGTDLSSRPVVVPLGE